MRKVVNLNETPSAADILTQFLMSFGVLILSTLIFSFAGVYLAALFTGTSSQEILRQLSGELSVETLNGVKIIQIFSQIGTFILPALILPVIFFKVNPYKYTGLLGRAPILLYALGLLSFYALMPVLELVITLNQKMDLPYFLQGVENWMRKSEETQEKMTGYLLYMPTFGHFLSNVFVIAVLPAVAEELFFRGFLQRTLYNWWRRKHLAVILSAIIFSAIHMQFFGFFPRFFLGMFLGYLLVWSGDLKLSMFVHFLNNFTSLLVAYLYRDEKENFDINAPMADYPFYIYIISAVLGGYLLYQLYTFSRKKRINETTQTQLPLETGDIQWAKVFSSQSIYEAEIVAGNLESEGISAVVFNKKDSSYGFGEAEVHVHTEDTLRAQQLISSFKL
ncbi:MAG: CPBP family intramembrane metalloprotease [Sphingobacteriales bacterium]|nr:MAG: CPBP family intramembrane metalloprotease [Sphingobacteriales bacterium]